MSVPTPAVLAAGILLWCVVCCVAAEVRPAERLYVAPNGNDLWSGSLPETNGDGADGPLATLEGARDALRKLTAQAKVQSPVVISLRGGTYRLERPFVLQPEDGGTVQCPVTYCAYEGEQVVISGGRQIGGWKQAEGGLWVAEIPEVKAGGWTFRELFVNGQRRQRTRVPETGLLPVAGGASPEAQAFTYRPGDIKPSWAHLSDVEVVVVQYWTEARLRIATIDDAAHVVSFTGGSWRPLTWSRGYYVENVREALGAPGRWYLDKEAGVLSYMPLPGEDMATAEVIAPVAEQLVRLEGSVEGGRPVQYVSFEGLSLQHTADPLAEAGHAFPQAELPAPVAFAAEGARNCTVRNCSFSHTGGWAVGLGRGCQGNAVEYCRFEDLGAGGVRIGEEQDAPTDALEACGNRVEDSTFTGGCETWLGAPAIWVGQSSGNVVAHNDISGAFMWGISVGWNWSYMPPNRARDNVVEYNHVHDVGTGVLGIHGGIYCLGLQPGTVVRRNLVHDTMEEPLGGDGIVLDNGCGAIVVEDNIVYRAGRESFCFNFNCLGNVVQNNIFALSSRAAVNRYGDPPTAGMEPPPNANFWYRNIHLLKSGKVFLEESWLNYQTICDYNLYWDVSAGPIRFLTHSFDEWKAKGLDGSSVVADPLFVDAEGGDFSLKPESPALKLGFRPIDVSGVGPRRVDGQEQG